MPSTSDTSSLPSLDPPHFSVDLSSPDDRTLAADTWLWRDKLELKQLSVLALEEVAPEKKTSQRLERCGRGAWIFIHAETRKLRIVANKCGLRYCPRCSRRLRARLADEMSSAMKNHPEYSWRFVTLTLQSSAAPLRDQISFLRASFRRLRQQALWSASQDFGWAVVELTYNEESHLWHPHLHVVTKGRWIPQASLSLAWAKASNGSSIVDIRGIKRNSDAIGYITKYVGKAPPILKSVEGYALLVVYYRAVISQHLVIRWGQHPDAESEEDHDEPESYATGPGTPWSPIIPLSECVILSWQGSVLHREILQCLWAGYPLPLPGAPANPT